MPSHCLLAYTVCSQKLFACLDGVSLNLMNYLSLFSRCSLCIWLSKILLLCVWMWSICVFPSYGASWMYRFFSLNMGSFQLLVLWILLLPLLFSLYYFYYMYADVFNDGLYIFLTVYSFFLFFLFFSFQTAWSLLIYFRISEAIFCLTKKIYFRTLLVNFSFLLYFSTT